MKKFYLICYLLLPQILFARWAGVEEAAWKIKVHSDIKIKEDGSYTEQVEEDLIISKERGKNLGTRGLVYESQSENIEIKEAYTKKDDKKYFGSNSMCFIENFEMKSGPYLDELAKPCNGDWGNPIFWIQKE